MIRKTWELEAEVPINLCFELLQAIASQLNWKLKEHDPVNHKLKWEHKTYSMAPTTTIYVDLKQIGNFQRKSPLQVSLQVLVSTVLVIFLRP